MELKILGKTECGNFLVVHGEEVFRLFDTSGLPLEIVFMELKDRGYMPDWTSFKLTAENHGWKVKTIITRLTEATSCYTHVENFTETVISRLYDNI
jgi:alanyl-tRNA synthetase